MAIEIAHAYVSVSPNMSGAARQIESSMSGVGDRIGKSISSSVSQSVQGVSATAASAIAERATQGVENATRGLTVAEQELARAQGQRESAAKGVQTAELRLSELRDQGREGTAQYAKAEQQLIDAQLKQVDASGRVERAQQGVTTANSALTDAQSSLATATADAERELAKQETVLGRVAQAAPGAAESLTNIGTRLQEAGKSISDVGSTLTKRITLPAVGAAAAVGGMVGAFGWRRLVAMDTAQAQLRGLGYEAQDVERITLQVTDAIEGGMTTMAEGTAIAAGALAAGVEEGAELERYIRLVGDAAVGANRPVDEMAQIFNRVQGGGRLMTQELNMIEQSLPGFAATMAESMGVSQATFREMVTAGEVDAAHFMDVMDNFAGGMAEAYADSWEGLVGNTKAWIGIIGESILEGVFQEAKGELADFQEWLQTDDVQQWAQDAGAAIGNAFGRIVETVRDAIEWWGNLDDSTKRLIGGFAGVAIAAGPVLLVVGKIMTVIGGFMKFIAPIVAAVDRLAGGFGGVGAAAGRLLPMLLRFAGPIGLIVSGLIMAWQQSEEFRDAVMELGDALMGAFQEISTALMPLITEVFGAVAELGGMFATLIAEVATSLAPVISMIAGLLADLVSSVIVPLVSAITAVLVPVIQALLPVVQTVFGVISKVIGTVMKVVQTVIKAVTQAIRGDWSGAWNTIRNLFTSVWNAIKNIVSAALEVVKKVLSSAWNTVRSATSTAWNAVRTAVMNPINATRAGLTNVLAAIRQYISAAWNYVRSTTSNAWQNVRAAVTSGITSVLSTVAGLPGQIMSALGNMGTLLLSAGSDLIRGFTRGIRNMAGSIISTVRSTVTNALPNFVRSALGIASPSKLFRSFGEDVMAGFAIGLHDGGDDVLGEMEDVVAGLTKPHPVDVSATGAARSMLGDFAPAGAGASGRSQEFNIYETSDPRSTAAQVARTLTLAGG